MANTSAVYARIDSGLKESAESILQQLGISPSSAIQMLYSQIVLTRGMPLDLHLPSRKPTAIGGMSREELDAELMKGKRILIVDDVVSTGESVASLTKLVEMAGGINAGICTILAEGDAADRKDIIYLEKLPLFDREGKIL